jgi:hypothetical protein
MEDVPGTLLHEPSIFLVNEGAKAGGEAGENEDLLLQTAADD